MARRPNGHGSDGEMMEQATTKEDVSHAYRGPPLKPWLVLPTPPLRQEQLVQHARNCVLPQRPLTENVGTALRGFYADVLAEPLPPGLVQLAQGLQVRGG